MSGSPQYSDRTAHMKPRILVFADWYLPGYKAGGAVSAISNLIELVGDKFDFWVFTRDRDLADQRPYSSVPLNQWVTVGKARVFYTSEISLRSLLRRVREIHPDIIYLNSFFSRFTVRTLLLRKLGLLPSAGIVLAPRGEFSPGALELKSLRKWPYCKLAFAAGLYRDVTWQASSKLEEEHIRSVTVRAGFRGDGDMLVAPDVPNPSLMSAPPPASRFPKQPGAVRFVFLSRVSRMKNLEFVLELLGPAAGEIELDIYGPIEDPAYWRRCEAQIRRLPDSIRVSYKGPLAPEQVLQVFGSYHFQLLPTLGENFGYTIIEGLAAGCPVLTSDQTPWRALPENRAGWDLPLQDRAQWRETIQRCVDMDRNTYQVLSLGARTHFEEKMSTSAYRRRAMELFQKALGAGANPTTAPAPEKSAKAAD
jgi:glycosyltransferase involved in cell wall biosynthesis